MPQAKAAYIKKLDIINMIRGGVVPKESDIFYNLYNHRYGWNKSMLRKHSFRWLLNFYKTRRREEADDVND